MSDKNDNKPSGSQKSESGSHPSQESFNRDSVEYGERKGTIVTNTFKPPVRPDRGENNGDQPD